MIEILKNIDILSVIFYIFIGFAPGIVWLLLYLKEDEHPEPSRMIFSVFLWGMIAAPFAYVAEYIFLYFSGLSMIDVGIKAIFTFIVLAFIEEWLKYRVVLKHAENNPAFDEPVDAMIYLIIAALGFATIENILYIISAAFEESFFKGLSLTVYRFAGATFLHTLASAIMGYFLAFNFFFKKSKFFLYFGLIMATIFHAIYNYLLIKTENIGTLILFLTLMTALVLKMFHSLKTTENKTSP